MRLSNEIKLAVKRNAIIKAGCVKEIKKLAKDYGDFAEALRKHRIASLTKFTEKQIRRIYEKYEADMPADFRRSSAGLRYSTDISPNLSGMQPRLSFDGRNVFENHILDFWFKGAGSNEKTRFLTESTAPRLCPMGGNATCLPEHTDQFHALEKRRDELGSKVLDIAANVSAVLARCTTVKKLLELWPEAKALLPSPKEIPAATLPAVQIADLNKLVNLP
jgi:hypothetical protein